MRENRVLVGSRKGMGVRKTGQEPLVVRDNRFNPRLLKHDLGNPHRVGIPGRAPRKLARSLVVPIEQLLLNRQHAGLFVEQALGVLQRLDQIVCEVGTDVAVDHAVIERQGEQHDLADDDLSIPHDR